MCKRNEDKRDIHVVELMLYALFQDKRENKKTERIIIIIIIIYFIKLFSN